MPKAVKFIKTTPVHTIFASKIHQNGLPFIKIFEANLPQTEPAEADIFNRAQVVRVVEI